MSVQIVVDFRPLGQREAHALENVDNLVLHDGQRMARTQTNRVGRTRQVDVVGLVATTLQLLLERVDMVESQLFQLVDFHSDHLLLLGSHIAEIRHQRVDFALSAEVFQTQLFNFFGTCRRQSADFLQQCFYFL